jgi:ParB family chromosome partitioning protein
MGFDLHEDVVHALDTGEITQPIAAIIGTVSTGTQPQVLKILLDRGETRQAAAQTVVRMFANATIFTIGYQGRDITAFIDVLHENAIDLVVDIRYVADPGYLPEFDAGTLKRDLERSHVDYRHRPEYGIPPTLHNPYQEGALSYECLEQWYTWHVYMETQFDDFIERIKQAGRTALMCAERHATPWRNQPHACHRNLLANLILDHQCEDPLLRFTHRIDL